MGVFSCFKSVNSKDSTLEVLGFSTDKNTNYSTNNVFLEDTNETPKTKSALADYNNMKVRIILNLDQKEN